MNPFIGYIAYLVIMNMVWSIHYGYIKKDGDGQEPSFLVGLFWPVTFCVVIFHLTMAVLDRVAPAEEMI